MPSKNAYRNFVYLLFAFMLSYPVFLSEGLVGKGIELILGLAVLGLGLWMTSSHRRRIQNAGLVGGVVFVLWVFEIAHPAEVRLAVGRLLIQTLFFGRVIFLVASHVFFSPAVSPSNRLYGAVAVYMLTSAFFANLYFLVNLIQPGSFSCGSALCEAGIEASFRAGAHLYFSLVTLTSVGYGDILPIRPFSSMLSSLEALAGQLYVAIVVARLVGIHLMDAHHQSLGPQP